MAAGKRDKTLTRGSMNYEKNRGRVMDFYFEFANDIFIYDIFSIFFILLLDYITKVASWKIIWKFLFLAFIKFVVNK